MKITMIAAGVGEGKTSRFLTLFEEHKDGAIGFYSKKEYQDGELIGYSLVNLVTGEEYPHCKLASLHEHTEGLLLQGRWTFNPKAFEWAAQAIQQADSIWLDEVGALEMKGQGFSPIINFAIDNNIDLYIAIREKYTNQIFDENQFDITILNV